MVDRLPCPDKECFQVQGSALLDGLVEGREAIDLLEADIFVEDQGEDWETCVNGRVTQDKVAIVDRDRHKEVQTCEDGLNETDNHATMHNELRQGSASLIGQTTVPDDEFLDVTEFGDREIGSKRGLHAFLTHDAETDVSLLDHGDIIATISNAGNDLASHLLDLDCNDRFLSRTAPAYTDCFRRLSHIEELLTELLMSHDYGQRCAINHKHVRRGQILIIVYLFVNSIDLCLIGNHLDILISVLQSC